MTEIIITVGGEIVWYGLGFVAIGFMFGLVLGIALGRNLDD